MAALERLDAVDFGLVDLEAEAGARRIINRKLRNVSTAFGFNRTCLTVLMIPPSNDDDNSTNAISNNNI